MTKKMGLLFLGIVLGASWVCAESGGGAYTIDIGSRDDEAHIGYGWSIRERAQGQWFRWIDRYEADIWISLSDPVDRTVTFRAWAPWLSWRRQRIGLFVNNRYVTEFPGPPDATLHDYEAEVSESYWIPGLNRVTLRLSYRTRQGRDSRKLALAVEHITLSAP